MTLPVEELRVESSRTLKFYRSVIRKMSESGIPFLIGGSWALRAYTGISRVSKDLDIFIRPFDLRRTLDLFSDSGYETEITSQHWLGKIFHEDNFVDIIFGSGKYIKEIDEDWFRYSVPEKVLGLDVRLCPPEEMIWSKAYIMERERYDGADISHLILVRSDAMDWSRLLRRFGSHWQLLLSLVTLFCYIYPSERTRIPDAFIKELLDRMQRELSNPPATERVCRGTALSLAQYLVDVEVLGFQDGRQLDGEMENI